MCRFFNLYKCVYADIIVNWLNLEELVHLDTSCSKKLKPLLQDVCLRYSHQIIRAYFPSREICIPSIPMIRWLNKFNIMLEHVTLGNRHFDDDCEIPKDRISLNRFLSCHKGHKLESEDENIEYLFDWFACVQSLRIENLCINDRIVSMMQGFANLERLDLSYNAQVVPLLNQVATYCRRLTELHLAYWDFNEEPLISMLRQCPQLTALFLSDCISSERFALHVIVHCPNIVAFNCVRCCLESKRPLGQMFALHRHTADFAKIHSHSETSGFMDTVVLRHSLWSCGPNIHRLELSLWDAEKTIFAEVVTHCPLLTSLVVSGYCKSANTSEGIKDLVRGLPGLKYLRLQGMSIQTEVVNAIASFGGNLTELHLVGQVESFVRLHVIGQCCPLLRSLTLTACKSTHMDCDLVYILFRCTQLTSLDLCRLNISDEAFLSLSHVPRLTHLNISFNKLITDTTLHSLAAHCWRLRDFEIRMCPLITDNGMHSVLTHCSIAHLDVSYCPLLTAGLVSIITRECSRRLETLKICMTKLTVYRPLKKLLLKCKRLRLLTLWEWKKVAPLLIKVKKRHKLKVKFF